MEARITGRKTNGIDMAGRRVAITHLPDILSRRGGDCPNTIVIIVKGYVVFHS